MRGGRHAMQREWVRYVVRTVEVSSKVHNGNCRGGSELHNEIFKLLLVGRGPFNAPR
jgi:hypothetical protein